MEGRGSVLSPTLFSSFLCISLLIAWGRLRFSRHFLWTYLLGCDAVKSGAFIPTFRRNLSFFFRNFGTCQTTQRHVPDSVIFILFSCSADSNTPCYRPDVPAWPQLYVSTWISGRRRFDLFSSLSLCLYLSIYRSLPLSLWRLERGFKLIQGHFYFWQLSSTYPSLSFRLTAGNAAFAAIPFCLESFPRALLQCTAANTTFLFTMFKALAMGFPSASPHESRLRDRLLDARHDLCWCNSRHYFLNVFLHVVCTARIVPIHFIV